MPYDIFLISMISVILVEIIAIVYWKYRNSNYLAENVNSSGSGKYHGVERRAQKRTAGALYHLSDGHWKFR